MVRDVYVGFSKPKMKFPIYSWLIRALEHTEFSHVYVWHDTKYNLPIIYQASGVAVNFMSGPIFKEKNEVVKEFCFQVTDVAFQKYMQYALENVGRDYSLKQAFGILVKKLFRLKQNPFSNGRSDYICSELVAVILDELMSFKLPTYFFDYATPKDIYLLCQRIEKERTQK